MNAATTPDLQALLDQRAAVCQTIFDVREIIVGNMSIESALAWLTYAKELERLTRAKKHRAAACRVARVLETAIGARLNESDDAEAVSL